MNDDEPVDDHRIVIQVRDPQLEKHLSELLAATLGIRIVAAGEQADLILNVAPVTGDGDLEALTARERDVLALLAEGLSNRAIAERLGIALDTAKFHVGRVIDKLDATGRTDAVAHAMRRGIIHL